MSKSYRNNSDDSGKPDYRAMAGEHRSMVALGMIVARTGIGKFHKDKRDRRGARDKQWERDED
jgi:hypothetical protein